MACGSRSKWFFAAVGLCATLQLVACSGAVESSLLAREGEADSRDEQDSALVYQAKLSAPLASHRRRPFELSVKLMGRVTTESVLSVRAEKYDVDRREWSDSRVVVRKRPLRRGETEVSERVTAPDRALWRYRAEISRGPLWTTVSAWRQVKVTGDKPIALTFDDGPDPAGTPKVLDYLRDRGAHATFFMLGWRVERYPEVAERMVSEGHQLGSHRYTHVPGSRLTPSEFETEVKRSKAALDRVQSMAGPTPGGSQPEVFRYPWGASAPRTDRIVRKNHMRIYGWTYATGDGGDHGPRNDYVTDLIADKVIEHAKPGLIVLMHDGPDRPNSVAAVPVILGRLERKGYDFVTCEEMRQLERQR